MKQDIKKRLSKCVTVEELIKFLQKFPGSTPIGVAGHFGEFHEMDSTDFFLRQVYLSTETTAGFDEYNRFYFDALTIEQTDIGPEPL